MNRESDSFKNGHFTWFTGVVEEINDPDYLADPLSTIGKPRLR